jgi:serine/threonine protein kinase
VQRAQSRENKGQVAIKSIFKTGIDTSEKLNMLVNEVKAMRRLDFKNIVKMHRLYEDVEFIHLIIDLAEGQTLLDLIIEEETVNEEQSALIIFKILQALQYISTLKLIHRDLKLENVIVSANRDVRVLDFGLATDSLDGHATGICGSPGYIAPEILRGFGYGIPSDMFAVGVIMYALLTGELPFNGKTVEEKLRKNAKA